MIAIPLDYKDATTISSEYVKAPFFALIDTLTGYCKVIENTKKDSMVVELIRDSGASATVCYMMDDSLSELCVRRGMAVYEISSSGVTLDQIYEDLQKNRGPFA